MHIAVHLLIGKTSKYFSFADTPESPGNQGMLDLVMALEWTKKNIGPFGGDPNSVTLMGQSAGSMATLYLMLSPKTKVLIM